jgi:hypothetical protein
MLPFLAATRGFPGCQEQQDVPALLPEALLDTSTDC